MLDRNLEPPVPIHPDLVDYADYAVEEHAYEDDFMEEMREHKFYRYEDQEELEKIWRKYWVDFKKIGEKEDDDEE